MLFMILHAFRASSYLGRVDASNSKREYLCSIVGSSDDSPRVDY
jgi:hypothetical protein